MKTTVSIIVPVYNVQDFLSKCLDSLVSQDLKSYFEVLLIDDGSTDDSGKICEDYSHRYSYIQTFHKENGGLSDARNFGLKRAQGDYVHFIDSDDILSKDYSRIIIKSIQKFSPDLLHINYLNFFNEESLIDESSIVNTETSPISNTQMLKNLFCRKIENYTWSFIIKKNILTDSNFKFPINRNYEDIATTYFIIDRAEKVIDIKIPLYFYRTRKGSIATVPSFKNVIDVEKSLLEIEEYYGKRESSVFHEYFLNYKLSFLIFAYYENFRSRKLNLQTYKVNRKILEQKILNCRIYKSKVDLKFKVAYWLIRFKVFIPIQQIRTKANEKWRGR